MEFIVNNLRSQHTYVFPNIPINRGAQFLPLGGGEKAGHEHTIRLGGLHRIGDVRRGKATLLPRRERDGDRRRIRRIEGGKEALKSAPGQAVVVR